MICSLFCSLIVNFYCERLWLVQKTSSNWPSSPKYNQCYGLYKTNLRTCKCWLQSRSGHNIFLTISFIFNVVAESYSTKNILTKIKYYHFIGKRVRVRNYLSRSVSRNELVDVCLVVRQDDVLQIRFQHYELFI